MQRFFYRAIILGTIFTNMAELNSERQIVYSLYILTYFKKELDDLP